MVNVPKSEDTIDFKALLFKFYTRWYLFVLSLIAAYFGAKFYTQYKEPIFRVSTTILLEDDNNSSSTAHLGGLDLFNPNKNLQNEIGLITSFDMVYRTISKLNFDVSYFHVGKLRTAEMYKDSPFSVDLDSASFQVVGVPFYIKILNAKEYQISAAFAGAEIQDMVSGVVINRTGSVNLNSKWEFGKLLKTDYGAFTVNINNPHFETKDTKLFFLINNRSRLTQAYKNKLGVYSVNKESTILELAVSGALLLKDIDFLNKLTEVYIDNDLQEKNQITTNTIKFIDDQLNEIAATLKGTEGEMEEFRSRNKVVDLETATTNAVQRLEDLEGQRATIQLNLKYYNYILDYVSKNKELKDIVAPSTIGISDPLLTQLLQELLELKQERNIIENQTTGQNQYLLELDKRIDNTTKNLQENLRSILETSNITSKDLETRIHAVESTISSLPESEREFLNIQRKYNLNDHLYNFLLERRAEAGITKASNKSDGKILNRASYLNAYQIEPKSNQILSSFLMIGLIIPFILILIMDFFSVKINSKDELQRLTKIPVVGMIGHNKIEKNQVVLLDPKSKMTEMFRSIRITLQYLAPDKNKKVIGLTSSVGGEGKSFCSLNIAGIFSLTDKKTILIGADLRKPKLFGDFNLTNDKGLSTYLSNQHSLDEIIYKATPNLDLILAGPLPPNPSELLGSLKMEELLAILKEKYEFIVIDTAPIGLISDYLLLEKFIDINLYVVRHNYTHKKLLKKINEMYDAGKFKNLNIIINDIDNIERGYNYGYEYNYDYGYGAQEESTWRSKLKNLFRKRN